MSIQFRAYHPQAADYALVERFLIEHYQPLNRDGNWLAPAWEYMHSHPALDRASLGRIGLWEQDGRLVAVAIYESVLGEAFFQLDPACAFLRPALLDHAETHLAAFDQAGGGSRLCAFINQQDPAFAALAQQRGFIRDPAGDRPLSALAIPDPFPPPRLPPGFAVQSLAEALDWRKLDRVLWRGFNHPGEPPEDGPAVRQAMAQTPHFALDLKIVTLAPNGDFASFCGMWFEPAGRYCYLEPVATDPTYRRLGLGAAAVLEGIRRCAALGATIAYVGTDQPFYKSLGFEPLSTSECWVKQGTAAAPLA
jgi:GNAT superfamily N-acetyltransferase